MLLSERQKLVRKIKKLKRAKKESSEGVEEELFEARALLNYVLVSAQQWWVASVLILNSSRF